MDKFFEDKQKILNRIKDFLDDNVKETCLVDLDLELDSKGFARDTKRLQFKDVIVKNEEV